jgi:hypothetical protein
LEPVRNRTDHEEMSEMPGRIGIEYTYPSASQDRGIELQEIREFASEVFGTETNFDPFFGSQLGT